MNKKLALLRFLASNPGWHPPAALAQELQIARGSIGPFLTDLQEAGLIEHELGGGDESRYRSLVTFATKPGG
jgi:DNA-binding IclR family transcriptional regulator